MPTLARPALNPSTCSVLIAKLSVLLNVAGGGVAQPSFVIEQRTFPKRTRQHGHAMIACEVSGKVSVTSLFCLPIRSKTVQNVVEKNG